MLSADFQLGVFFLGMGLLMELVVGMIEDEMIYFGFFCAFISLIFVVVGIIKMNKKGRTMFILDRIDGEIIFPINIYNSFMKSYDISNVRIDRIKNEVYYLKEDGQHYLMYDFLDRIISKESFINDWNFIFWYMDKNRPLPPDRIFDEYRQQDYERRKAEGFPRPLQPGVGTREITKEQQKERMAIGGW
ncbi:hypothetical protein [Aquimarina sp. MAR_2010_214]|uniref:hypothetical protein n=1 Tax=Aquimarina sp. MAR_2010_214 TaxID=1250026 RepID=UPI00130478EF|nr:hypothetical protein [Aquimarina sp. MAR_2010_214]